MVRVVAAVMPLTLKVSTFVLSLLSSICSTLSGIASTVPVLMRASWEET
jgi:hypothetical protein